MKNNKAHTAIQAGDYGKDEPEKDQSTKNVKSQEKAKADTDGRKTLALWS